MAGGPKSTRGLTMLVVEDDSIVLDICGRLIARQFPGLSVDTASTGEKGLEFFKKHASDLVITDINLPGMDGLRMAREIKSIKADTRFIVLTGYNDDVILKQISETGIDAFLVKPIDFGKLFALVARYIDEIKLVCR